MPRTYLRSRSGRTFFAGVALTCVCAVALLGTPAWSHDVEPHPHAEDSKAAGQYKHPQHGSLGSISAKLSDPTANVWALQFNIQAPTFYDGDLNSGDANVGGNVVFQPVMPFPLYGTGKDQWKLITRPIVPIVFTQPIPKGGVDNFKHVGGIGDIEIPLLINPPVSLVGPNMILGAGPVFEFPTATNDSLGAQQYSMGPAVVVGYKTKKWVAVIFPNYFWGFGSRADRDRSTTPTTNKASILYNFSYNLPGAWQVGTNPTISYNHNAARDDRWTVPVGLFVAKTIKIGKMPVKLQATAEYSVISPDSYGKRFALRFVVTPVIPGLVKKPIFGGGD
jgi:hypothetical protein